MTAKAYPFERWTRLSGDDLRNQALRRQLERRLRPLARAFADATSALALPAHADTPAQSQVLTRRDITDVDLPATAYVARLDLDDGLTSVLRLGGAATRHIAHALLGAAPAAARPLTDVEVALVDRVLIDALDRQPIPFLLTTSGNSLASLLRVFRSSTPLLEVRLPLTLRPDAETDARSVISWIAATSEIAAWLSRAPRPARAPAPLQPWLLDALELSVCLGWLDLDAATARQLEPGDLLVPAPRHLLLTPDTLEPAWLLAPGGARALPARLHLGSPPGLSLIPDTPSQEITVSDTPSHAHDLEGALRGAPVQLRVEIGRLRLSAERVSRLERGDILELDVTIGDPVTLLIGDTPVGRAELVDVDGKVGVRVLDLGDR